MKVCDLRYGYVSRYYVDMYLNIMSRYGLKFTYCMQFVCEQGIIGPGIKGTLYSAIL